MGTRGEQAERTRARIVTAARRLFARQGYFSTGTSEIVREAGVGTRGALYHHFAGKEALFAAVLEDIEGDPSTFTYTLQVNLREDPRWRPRTWSRSSVTGW